MTDIVVQVTQKKNSSNHQYWEASILDFAEYTAFGIGGTPEEAVAFLFQRAIVRKIPSEQEALRQISNIRIYRSPLNYKEVRMNISYKLLSSVITRLGNRIGDFFWDWHVDRLRENMDWAGFSNVVLVSCQAERKIRLEYLNTIRKEPGYRALMILLCESGWQFEESFAFENSEIWKRRRR